MTDLFDKVVFHTLDKLASQYVAATAQSERDRIDGKVLNDVRLIAPSDYRKFYRYYLTRRKDWQLLLTKGSL